RGGVRAAVRARGVAGPRAGAVPPRLRLAAQRLPRHRVGVRACPARHARRRVHRYALLGAAAGRVGLVLGAVMFGGAWIGRRLLDRMSDRVFLAVIEALLVVMGLQFLLLPR